jgi:hypothetical protein
MIIMGSNLFFFGVLIKALRETDNTHKSRQILAGSGEPLFRMVSNTDDASTTFSLLEPRHFLAARWYRPLQDESFLWH